MALGEKAGEEMERKELERQGTDGGSLPSPAVQEVLDVDFSCTGSIEIVQYDTIQYNIDII